MGFLKQCCQGNLLRRSNFLFLLLTYYLLLSMLQKIPSWSSSCSLLLLFSDDLKLKVSRSYNIMSVHLLITGLHEFVILTQPARCLANNYPLRMIQVWLKIWLRLQVVWKIIYELISNVYSCIYLLTKCLALTCIAISCYWPFADVSIQCI